MKKCITIPCNESKVTMQSLPSVCPPSGLIFQDHLPHITLPTWKALCSSRPLAICLYSRPPFEDNSTNLKCSVSQEISTATCSYSRSILEYNCADSKSSMSLETSMATFSYSGYSRYKLYSLEELCCPVDLNGSMVILDHLF